MENKTALLVMDLQAGIVPMIPDSASLLDRTKKAIAHARDKKLPVIYVVVGFRQNGAPEVSPNNKLFSGFKERMAGADMSQFMAVAPELGPLPEEPVVAKRRVSAFAGSDLDVLLRSLGIQHLVLTGVATGGVVLSTVREASDKDFQLTVLSDGCADHDMDLHHVLLTKVLSRQADVMTIDEWCSK